MNKGKMYRSLKEALKTPDDVYQIDLSGHELTELDDNIGKLKNLEILILDHNKLKGLPKSIEKLKNLEDLYLEFNQFTKLPNVLKELKKLEIFSLKCNNLQKLPDFLVEFKELELLHLGCNKFSKTEIKRIKELLPNVSDIYFDHTSLYDDPSIPM